MTFQKIIKKYIRRKIMKIVVSGTGYVGLVTAVCLAEKGNQVVCYDVVKEKIDTLNSGKSPIYEQGLEELMEKNKKKITYTLDKKLAYKDADVIFIGVGTPERLDGSANLDYVYQVADDIVENINKDCLVVITSTVPIGTNYKIEAYIQNKLNGKYKMEIASNPEFLAQGTAVIDTLEAQRIVIGTHSKWAETILREIYKNFNKSELVSTDINSAEMIKYASNDFLALKISYINEIANLCEILGANIEDVTKGMGLDKRIGDKFLNAGIGYGGSCFPKDTKALHWLAKINDCELKTIKAAIDVNQNQKLKLIEKSKKYYNNTKNLNVAVLGLAFKPGTDDLREAPSLINVEYLKANGANIKAWDPIATKNFAKKFPDIIYCNTIDETIENADICFIFTQWEEIKQYDISKYVKLMKKPIVLDGRNCYDLEKIKNEKLIYESIGRKIVSNIK